MPEECMKAFSILSRKQYDINNYSKLKVKGNFKCFNSASFTPNISIREYIQKGKSIVARESMFW